jgi:hypothetical protein
VLRFHEATESLTHFRILLHQLAVGTLRILLKQIYLAWRTQSDFCVLGKELPVDNLLSFLAGDVPSEALRRGCLAQYYLLTLQLQETVAAHSVCALLAMKTGPWGNEQVGADAGRHTFIIVAFMHWWGGTAEDGLVEKRWGRASRSVICKCSSARDCLRLFSTPTIGVNTLYVDQTRPFMADALRLVSNWVALEAVVMRVFLQVALGFIKLRRPVCSDILLLSRIHLRDSSVHLYHLHESRSLIHLTELLFEFVEDGGFVWNFVRLLVASVGVLKFFVTIKRLWRSAKPSLLKIVQSGFSSLLVWWLRARLAVGGNWVRFCQRTQRHRSLGKLNRIVCQDLSYIDFLWGELLIRRLHLLCKPTVQAAFHSFDALIHAISSSVLRRSLSGGKELGTDGAGNLGGVPASRY